MKQNKYSKELKEFCKTLIRKDGNINVAILKTPEFKNSKELEKLLKETVWLDNIRSDSTVDIKVSTRIKIVNRNINQSPICRNPKCNNPVSINSYNSFNTFCSKSCAASLHNKTTRKETLSKKSKEFYNNSKILSLEVLKKEIQKIRTKYKKAHEYRLNRAGLGKSIDFYVKEDVDMYIKADMILHDILELKKCKNPDCSNKVNHYKHEFCSPKCQVNYNLSKMQSTCLEKYGYKNPFQVPEIKEKIVKTWLKKYGVTNPNKCREVREKIEQTCLTRYNFSSPFQNPITQEKIKKTNLERYGFEVPTQNPIIYDKVKQTNLKRYGFECCLQNSKVKEKIKQTNLERYGFENVMQSGLFSFGYKYYDYVLPSGKIIRLQGYENYLLDELLETYGEDEILYRRQDMPIFMYIYKDKKHRYFPDFFIPSTNTIYEVKSEYTLDADYEKNMLKFKAVKNTGYNFELVVIDPK